MAFDSKNNLWTLGGGGLESWNIYSRVYKKYRIDARIPDVKDIYEFIEDQDGAMWFATSVGAARLEGDQWTFLGDDNNLAKNPLTDIAKGPDGALWFGWKGGLIRFDGTIWTAYTKTNGLLDNDVSDIAIDPQGVVWVSSAKGMSRFDGRNWRTYQENDHYIFANGGPACLAIAPDGSVWGSQKYHGIINIRGDTIRAYFLQGVLSRFSPAIDAIGVGADGKVWVVTDGSGIFWFDGSQWSNFTLVLGLGDPYEGGFPGGGPVLRGPDGAVWMGNWFYGVIRYDGSWWQMNWSGGLRDEWIVSVDSADDGAMWFATKYGGVSRFDGTHWKTYELSVNEYPTKIRMMATGMNEDVWISTENSLGSDARGLFRLRNGSWSYLTTKNKPGTDNIISIVRTSDGNMWFGTYADGVWRHDGNTWTNYTVENGLAGNRVNGMAAGPDGTLWVATDKGVSRYDG
ncbi:MAG: two-component regulator propeller domain-containing protein, partial [Anaerolineales bacterium]